MVTPIENHGPSGPAGGLRRLMEAVARVLASLAGALGRLVRAVPRTREFLHFVVGQGEVAAQVPTPPVTVRFVAEVAMDEAIMAVALGPARFPPRAEFERVGAELRAARLLYSEEGWLEDPISYHRQPPPLADGDLVHSTERTLGIEHELVRYESGFDPRPDEPGAARWSSQAPNRLAEATVVRHGTGYGDRPWVVAVHGYTMGYPLMNFPGLRVHHLHHGLGLNVALPVLPLHGRRKVTRLSGEPLLSFDLMKSVHGITQAVWDIRRLLSWLRRKGATQIAVYGVSLGAYVAALLAGLDTGLDGVVAGIPVADLPRLFRAHSPVHVQALAAELELVGDHLADVHRVVSPLAVAPLVPRRSRFIFAGLGDRMAFPEQATMLWEHWERPAIAWYPGNHVGYLWSRRASSFLTESLRAVLAFD